MPRKHSPEFAVPTGKDTRGNYTFQVESSSTEGLWYDVVIWANGSTGVCTCQAYQRLGHCTMVDNGPALIRLAETSDLVVQLFDLSAGLMASVLDNGGDYELDEPTIKRALELEARADHYLEERLD